MNKEIISNSQFTIIIIMFVISSATLISPSMITSVAKQDAWFSTIIATSCGLLLAKLYAVLAGRYPGSTLAEYSEWILGKWIGRVVSLLYFLYFFLLAAVLLRIIGDFLTTVIMPETPIQAVEIVFCLTVILGVRLGLETFTRTSEMLLPWVLFFFMLLVLFLIPEIKPHNLSPFLENGIHPVLHGAFPLLGVPFFEMALFLMIAPNVTQTDKIGRNMIAGVLIGGGVLMMIVVLSITVLGSDFTSRLNYPVYELAQKINIGRFIQRIEIIAGGIFFITVFVKITIVYYSMVLSLAQTLRLSHYKTLTFPLGMMVIVLSLLLSPNIIHFQMFGIKAWAPLSMIPGLVLPVLMLVVDTVKRRMKKQ